MMEMKQKNVKFIVAESENKGIEGPEAFLKYGKKMLTLSEAYPFFGDDRLWNENRQELRKAGSVWTSTIVGVFKIPLWKAVEKDGNDFILISKCRNMCGRHLFSSEANGVAFESALREYCVKNKKNLDIQLSDEEIKSLQAKGTKHYKVGNIKSVDYANLWKNGHIQIIYIDGKLDIEDHASNITQVLQIPANILKNNEIMSSPGLVVVENGIEAREVGKDTYFYRILPTNDMRGQATPITRWATMYTVDRDGKLISTTKVPETGWTTTDKWPDIFGKEIEKLKVELDLSREETEVGLVSIREWHCYPLFDDILHGRISLPGDPTLERGVLVHP